MKAIFLCEKNDKLFHVYAPKTMEALRELNEIEAKIYQKADILADPVRFQEVELIFSTWGMSIWTEEEIRRYLPSLKCLFYAAGTVQAFARPFLASGVKVYSAWAANAVPVAEMTVAQIILANKGYYLSSRRYRSNADHRAAKDAFNKCRGNYGETVGIIGAGMIGKLVIEMLRPSRLAVKVFDPFLADAEAERLGVTKCSLDELFAGCRVVSNHLANNEQTKGMLCGSLFQQMMPDSTFINTGRGAQVVEAELIETLKNRPDITAILDVTYPEPPKAESEFYSLPNCILTPHIAGSIGNEVHRMSEYMLAEYRSYIKNEPCKYEVTEKMLETMA